jgi:hypothetical protein
VADWACSNCGSTDPDCARCGAGRPRDTTGGGSSGTKPGWRCGNCETANAGATTECAACRAARNQAINIGSTAASTMATLAVTRQTEPAATGIGGERPPDGEAPAFTGSGGATVDSSASRYRAPLVAVGAVAAVLAVILVVVVVSSGHNTVTYVPTAAPSVTTTTLAPDSPTSTPFTAAIEAQALANLVSASAGQRTNVSTAANDLENCGNASADQSAFTQAASVRQSVVNQLGALQVALLPNGAEMAQDLSSALSYSIQSDTSYAQWAGDELSGCSTDYAADSNFAAAQQTDPQADSQKRAFASLWNAVAPQYGLPTWDPTKI